MSTVVLERPTPIEESPVREGAREGDASRARDGRPIGRWVAFVVPLAGYLVLAVLLTIRWHVYFGDAQSREANGFYVFFSNDPHLSAIGFVWNPLTSIVEMPLMLLHNVFPALTREALAASIMSAIFMAGTCYQVYRFFEDLDLTRLAKWFLLICFAIDPMIVMYGANGMSEALFNFTLAITVRNLARWLRDGSTRPLVVAGLWMGIAYAARNEMVAAAAFGTIVVAAVTYLRTEGAQRHRRYAALSDAVVFSLPFVVSFVLWAGVSWVIVGHPFEQLSSVYGTTNQIRVQGYNNQSYYGATGLGHFRYTAYAMWTLAPLAPAILALAGYRAWKRQNPALLAVLSVVGGVCVFELAAFTLGQITWALRYDIYVILLVVMAAGCAASPAGFRAADRSERVLLTAGKRAWALRSGLAGPLAALMLVPGFITTVHTEFYSSINNADLNNYYWVLWPHSKRGQQDGYRTQWTAINDLDGQLSALHLPNGSLMVDNFTLCVPMLIMMSPHPTQFAIPNDENYKERLGAPYQDGVRYMLVSDPSTTFGKLDSLNVAFPTLYDDGGGFAILAKQINLPVCGDFRLYRLLPIRT